MMFTTAIPVWLNITCDDCQHHQDLQMQPDYNLSQVYECEECGSTEIGKVNISGSANADMKTLEEVRV